MFHMVFRRMFNGVNTVGIFHTMRKTLRVILLNVFLACCRKHGRITVCPSNMARANIVYSHVIFFQKEFSRSHYLNSLRSYYLGILVEKVENEQTRRSMGTPY